MPKVSFDFASADGSWVAGLADYDPESIDDYQFQHGYRQRPSSTGKGGSLFISGMNRSDDLFMYYKQRIGGLDRSAEYGFAFTISLASQYVSISGIGGDPARSVYLKACVSTFEPTLVMDGGTARLNIDIGHQSNQGANSVVLGDIEKPRDGTDSYRLIKRQSTKALLGTTDDDGGIWLLFGTDSGYEGETALYYTGFEAAFDHR